LWERPDCIARCNPGEGYLSTNSLSEIADRDPSSVAHFVHATFLHKGRREAELAAPHEQYTGVTIKNLIHITAPRFAIPWSRHVTSPRR